MGDSRKAAYEDEMDKQYCRDIKCLAEKTKDINSLLHNLQKIQDCINRLAADDKLALTRVQRSQLDYAQDIINKVLS